MVHHAPGVVPPGGKHLFLDIFGASRLDDIELVRETCVRAGTATGAMIIGELFHHFGEGCGVTGIVALAESHVSIHTWPEQGIATIDVYVCGDCDPTKAVPVFVAAFSPTSFTIFDMIRGVPSASDHPSGQGRG
jgi:S-adenosylmethionine decarboxylase